MNCHTCGGKLRVVRTVTAGPAGKTQEAECSDCGGRFTCVVFVLRESKGYGNGAEATAKRLRDGQIGLKETK